MGREDELIVKVCTLLLVMYGTSLHEMAHAYVATWLGDPTPGRHGRLTWNPIPHLDPVVTAIVLPTVTYMMAGSLIMLAATPINPQRFRKPLRDRALVAVAGPIMNLLLAAVLIAVVWIPNSLQWPQRHDRMFAETYIEAIFIRAALWNVILAIFNMLPIPPLDGYWIVRGAIPLETRIQLDALAISPWALMIVLVIGSTTLGAIMPFIISVFVKLLPI